MRRYLKIWWIMTSNATQHNFTSRFGAMLLIVGKIIRFLFFLAFLFVIGTKTKVLSGYTLPQMIVFFLTYQLIDTLPQLLMRMVYRFRGDIVTGDFDYYLTKPFSPLFRALFGWADVLDIPMFVITILCLVPAIAALGTISIAHVFMYSILLVNSFFIALAFHILLLSLGILTTEIDNATMFYRDVTQMGRIPITIYHEPLRGFLTFVIPISIMMTVPAQALLGIVTVKGMLIAFLLSIDLLVGSLLVWQYALREYASASS